MVDDRPAGWPQRFGPDDWHRWATAAGRAEPDGLDALAALLSLRWHHRRRRRSAESELLGRSMPTPVMVVGLAGAVASGKSTIAAALAERLTDEPYRLDTAVVSTDGFLRTNADLDAHGLTLRKGFPETYDLAALRRFHRRLRAGDALIPVPVYAHDVYDVAAEPEILERPEVLIMEGVNALQGAADGGEGPGDLADLRVFIDVDEDTVLEWFAERFVALANDAEHDPDSFYRSWSGLSDHEVRQVAREVWDAINGVNLRDHIEPSRSRADIEVAKAPSHEIVELRLHPG
jgi:type I pantothenate kinase